MCVSFDLSYNRHIRLHPNVSKRIRFEAGLCHTTLKLILQVTFSKSRKIT